MRMCLENGRWVGLVPNRFWLTSRLSDHGGGGVVSYVHDATSSQAIYTNHYMQQRQLFVKLMGSQTNHFIASPC